MKGVSQLKAIMIGMGVIVCLVLLYGVFNWLLIGPARARVTKHRVLASDFDDLLLAARQFMAARNSQTGTGPERTVTYWADQGFPDEMPVKIKDLKPLYVTVDSNRLYLRLNGTPRVGLNVFEAGTKEFGSEKVTNGLWFCY